MAHIESLTEIKHLDYVAIRLNSLMKDPSNSDIGIHFPETLERYSGTFMQTAENLREAAGRCKIGEREQFMAFVGKEAVGMSVVTNLGETPEGIDDSWPNLSGFVLHPHRGKGIGTLAMRHRIEVVNQNFGGHAWTYVREGNIPAEKTVLGVGFVKTDMTKPGEPDNYLYVYEA